MGLDRDAEQACRLLQEYSFDLEGYRPGELVVLWRDRLEADSSWIRSAVIEALYQGRYKAFSVEQILRLWKRRGYPIRHFNHEFERVILGPIDPTASKYAPMTTLSPSELLVPQAQAPNSHAGTVASAANTASPTEPGPPPQSTSQPEKNEQDVVQESEGDSSQTLLHQVSEWVSLVNPQPPVAATARPPSFTHPQPIRKFTPPPESSEFYTRLQSVARQSF
ncbi:MAG: hypothetical protein AAFQ89_19230 [Cyanobacteria bacterium J06626_18]